MPSAVESSRWDVPQLKERCKGLRDTLRVRKLASPEEIKAYWPGGDENQEPGKGGWIYCYANFVGFLRRAESSTLSIEKADIEVMKALGEQSILVQRVDSTEDEPPMQVQAKSLEAMFHVHALNLQLAWMAEQYELATKYMAAGSAEFADMLPKIVDAMAYTYHLLVWIVTSPGVELPYDPNDDRPEPPEHIRRLQPWDFVRICRAVQQHMLRLHALNMLIDERTEDNGGRRPTWSSLLSGLASPDTPPITLYKHRALASLIATATLRADAQRPRDPPAKEG